MFLAILFLRTPLTKIVDKLFSEREVHIHNHYRKRHHRRDFDPTDGAEAARRRADEAMRQHMNDD